MKLFTHHHHGWLRHDELDIETVLLETHSFLKEYNREHWKFVNETELFVYGTVIVYKTLPGYDDEYWFKAFKYNYDEDDTCVFCGGMKVDHYNPFVYCWACDGTAKQIRSYRDTNFRPKRIPKTLSDR